MHTPKGRGNNSLSKLDTGSCFISKALEEAHAGAYMDIGLG